MLVGAAMKMGAIIANASKEDQDRCYEFGKNLGIAFQLQDDYLDAFGDPKTFGKQVGGDIIENKKTYLYLKALEFSSETDQQQLTQLFSNNNTDPESKIQIVKQIFRASGSAEATQKAISSYTKKAFDILKTITISQPKKQILESFGTQLMSREV